MKTRTDISLGKAVTYIQGESDRSVGYAFIPYTKEELDTLNSEGLQLPTGDWGSPARMQELADHVRSKFNYMVDIHPARQGTPDYRSNTLPSDSIAIRPRNSNLYTAIAWWNESMQRYEIMSLRILKERRMVSSLVRKDVQEYLVTAVKDAKRGASVISGLRPYNDNEIATALVRSILYPVVQIALAPQKELYVARRSFRLPLDSEEMAIEILSMLDAIKENRNVHLAEDSPLLARYSTYDAERKAIQEKQGYVGEQAPILMFKSVVNNSVVIVCTDDAALGTDGYGDPSLDIEKTNVYITSYRDFNSVPTEIQRAVMTLEVAETNNMGIAKGVGVLGRPENTLCLDSCGFVIPIAARDKLLEEATQL